MVMARRVVFPLGCSQSAIFVGILCGHLVRRAHMLALLGGQTCLVGRKGKS